jgi:DNA polymerase I-like protein with 3'-5' exonuclease and polymerase domains/uracil-DNA glycosylase
MACKNCIVPYKKPVKFSGNTGGSILFLFDNPAPNEQRLVIPDILQKICNKVEFPVKEVFVASACRCWFDKSKLTAGQINSILGECKNNIDLILKELNIKIVVCFGAMAFQAVYKKSSLKNARNQFFEKDGIHIVCTYNVFAARKDPAKLPAIQSDLANIKRFINQGYKVQTDITYKEVETIRPILDGDCLKEGDFYLTGIDTEATGVHWYDPNYITISYQVSKNLTEGWTIVLYEEVEKDKGDFNIFINRGGTKKDPTKVEIGVKKTKGFDRKIDELRELLSRQDFKKYFFNQKFEQHAFMNLGITEFNNCCIDARVLAHTIDCNAFKNCSLDDLISYYTTYHSHKGDVNDVEKSDMFGLLKNDREKFIKYASLDPVLTLIVTQELKKEIVQDEKSLNYFVKFAQPIENEFLFEMERNGIRVDKTKIPEIKKQLKKEMEELLLEFKDNCPKEVYERHKDNFKLTRTIIIQEALFKWKDTKLRKNQTEPELHNFGFNLPPIIISKKSGVPSSDKKLVLKPILEGAYPRKAKKLVQLFIDWSERKQLIGNFLKNIELYCDKENKIHPSASITFTSSGRTGFRNPNLQNQPKRGNLTKLIRQLFIADEGCSLIENDYKASELAWVAQVSGDEKMTEIFVQNKDPHRIRGLRIRGLPENYEFKDEKELKETRQHAKPLNFGLIYLMNWQGLKRYAKQEYGVILTDKKARVAFDEFFSDHRGIKHWHERELAFLRKYGYLRTIFGRKQNLPNVYSDDSGAAAAAERTGINSLIQGPSSDMTLLSGLRIIKDKRINKKEFKIVLFIHDALVWCCKEGKYDYYLPIVKEYMEHVPDFGFKMNVPLSIEAEIGPNLAEMKKYNI